MLVLGGVVFRLWTAFPLLICCWYLAIGD